MKIMFNILFSGLLTIGLSACFQQGPKTEKELESYAIGIQLARKYKELGLQLDPEMVKMAVQDINNGHDSQISEDELRNWSYYTTQKISSGQQKSAEENLKTSMSHLETYMQDPDFKRTNEGLLVKVVKKGSGRQINANDVVLVNYTGRLMDGKVFDSSLARNRPAEFGLKNIIPGLRQAILNMQVGQKNEVVIPPNLAYGASGSNNIPPNSALKFELEIVGVK